MITLRAGTYLCPSIPVEYFEMILQYLEQKLGIHCTLLCESRWEGPREDREDPFLSGYLDLAWMNSTAFLRMRKDSSPVELLPLAAPGCYSDVIVHRDLGEKVKDFLDLRGCKWGYKCAESLSGHVITLANLKELGENASFFGNTLYSRSHLESVRMVVDKKVDAAAVDSSCLRFFRERNPHLAKDVRVLTSWGPLPPHPFVIRSDLDASLKANISQCLLSMHKDREGLRRLQEFHVTQFVPISMEEYDQERLIVERTKGLAFGTIYY